MRIKFVGDLEVVGKLKSFDKLPNLVLDDTIDARTGRELGVVFCKGRNITAICCEEGAMEISSPFD